MVEEHDREYAGPAPSVTRAAPGHARALRLLGAAALGLAIAAGARFWRDERGPVRRDDIADARTYWAREGFVEMVPPVRAPTSADGRARIVVYVRVAPGALLSLVQGPGGKRALRFPPGARVDRVEYEGAGERDAVPGPTWRVGDVRSTTFEPGGEGRETFRVLRPTADPHVLRGLRWPRGDDAAQAAATAMLGRLVENGDVAAPRDRAGRRDAAATLARINGCVDCHRPFRPPGALAALVHRGTDASGLYQPASILDDRAPLETYRPQNTNVDDPHLRFVCEGGAPATRDDASAGGLRCDGGEVPTGVLDVRGALRAGDGRVLRLCGSRAYLREHMDAAARAEFAGAFASCELSPAPP